MPGIMRVGRNDQRFLPVPDLRQATSYTCGVAALQSVLVYFGIEPPAEKAFAKEIGTDSKNGTDPGQITRAARKYGLTTEIKQHMTLGELESYVRRGIPVMVAYQAWTDKKQVEWKKDWVDGHYSVVVGMDAKNVYLEDPSILGSVGYISRQEFLDRWHDTDRNNRKYYNLGIVLTRPGFKPPRSPRSADRRRECGSTSALTRGTKPGSVSRCCYRSRSRVRRAPWPSPR
jgi:predicted double-glycine peptidase